ncbi:junctional sarcoplasmic reticulum protein 1 [Ctenodactylus gundi]
MTTRALDELDRGLGSCLAGEDLLVPTEPCAERPPKDKAARATPELADPSSWPQASPEPPTAGGADARSAKMEKGPAVPGAPGPGKEKLKSGASPRSAPARKKTQAAPPARPPPPPPAPEELPWGDVTLNKCLVLASLVALLGSACQLCHDAVAGEVAPASAPWVPPGSPPKEPVSPQPEPARRPAKPSAKPPSRPPAPRAEPPAEPPTEAGSTPEVPGSQAAVAEAQGDPGEATEEASAEEREPLADREAGEKLRRPRPRRERPARREKRPGREGRGRARAAGASPEARPRRWAAREGGQRPWARDPRDPEHRKKQVWAALRRPAGQGQGRPPGRRKPREGARRD